MLGNIVQKSNKNTVLHVSFVNDMRLVGFDSIAFAVFFCKQLCNEGRLLTLTSYLGIKNMYHQFLTYIFIEHAI